MRKTIISFLFSTVVLTGLSQEAVNLDVINKIKKEGIDNSKVMEIAFYLTDVSGPRLTSSPGFMNAANWAKNKLTEWGLKNARLDPWGEFGKSWKQEHCYVAMTAPYYQPLVAVPRAWTGSTPGKKDIKGEAFEKKIMDEAKSLQLSFVNDTSITVIIKDKTYNGTYKTDTITKEDEEPGVKLRISYVDEEFKFGDGPASPVTYTYIVEGISDNRLLLKTPRSMNDRKIVVLMNKQ